MHRPWNHEALSAPAKPLSARSVLGRAFSIFKKRPGQFLGDAFLWFVKGGLSSFLIMFIIYFIFLALRHRSHLPYLNEFNEDEDLILLLAGVPFISAISAQVLVARSAFTSLAGREEPLLSQPIQVSAALAIAASYAAFNFLPQIFIKSAFNIFLYPFTAFILPSALLLAAAVALFIRAVDEGGPRFLRLLPPLAFLFSGGLWAFIRPHDLDALELAAWAARLVLNLVAATAATFFILPLLEERPWAALKEIESLTRGRRLKITGLFAFAPLFALFLAPFVYFAARLFGRLADEIGYELYSLIPALAALVGAEMGLLVFPGLLAAALYAELRAPGAEAA